MDIKDDELVVVVRIRGIRNMKPRIKTTLDLLKLNKVNHAVIYKSNKAILSMIMKVKDYVTFGKIDDKMLLELIKKRAEVGSKNSVEVYKENELEDIVSEIKKTGKTDKIDKVFRLHPPRRGWKSIKLSYPKGDLGYRNNMADVLKRMI